LKDRRWHSSIFDVRRFRGANCDTDYYLVVAKVRERLSVSKAAAQKFDVERLNLKKVRDVKVREENQIQLSKRYPLLESLNYSKDMNRAWENIGQNIKISAKHSLGQYEWKQRNP
jgi:hypothetical protein